MSTADKKVAASKTAPGRALTKTTTAAKDDSAARKPGKPGAPNQRQGALRSKSNKNKEANWVDVPHSGPTPKLKVFKVNTEGSVSPDVTVNAPGNSEEVLRKLNLSELKDELTKLELITYPYTFCLADKSAVSQKMNVGDYLDALDPEDEIIDDKKAKTEQKDEKTAECNAEAGPEANKPKTFTRQKPLFHRLFLKVVPEEVPLIDPQARADDALNKDFMLKFVQKGESDTNEGSIQSSALLKPAASLSLAQIRRFVKNMSANSKTHEFCLADETGVADTMALSTYISKVEVQPDMDSNNPILIVYFHKTGIKSRFSAPSEELRKKMEADLTIDNSFSDKNLADGITIDKLKAQKADFSKMGLQENDIENLRAGTFGSFLHASELDEMEWQTVVRNCNLMYGWYFDLGTKSIKRAPHPAFRLRDGLNMPVEAPEDLAADDGMSKDVPSPHSAQKTAKTLKNHQNFRLRKGLGMIDTVSAEMDQEEDDFGDEEGTPLTSDETNPDEEDDNDEDQIEADTAGDSELAGDEQKHENMDKVGEASEQPGTTTKGQENVNDDKKDAGVSATTNIEHPTSSNMRLQSTTDQGKTGEAGKGESKKQTDAADRSRERETEKKSAGNNSAGTKDSEQRLKAQATPSAKPTSVKIVPTAKSDLGAELTNIPNTVAVISSSQQALVAGYGMLVNTLHALDTKEKAAAEEDADDTAPAPPAKPSSIPSFTVNDESKFEVTVVSTELQESMAVNNFSAESFEVGGSAAVDGVELGAKAGANTENQSGQGSVKAKNQKLMVGNYKLPRASVYLMPEDLEPTEELRKAIDLVRSTRNISHLRDLHRNFGHLFCKEVVIGGRLQSTRYTNASDSITESTEKSKFKASLGLQVSVPGAGSLSSKASHEDGRSHNQQQQDSQMQDAIIFEATGGNTILAADPPRWCASVLDYKNWRVIERAALSPMADMIAACADQELREVRQWFVQAVPGLSRYIAVPGSRSIDIRLKLMSDISGLTDTAKSNGKSNVCNYFGHQYGKPVHPIRKGLVVRKYRSETTETSTNGAFVVVTDLTTTLKQIEWHAEVALFTPAQTQAPVILQYEDRDKSKDLTPEEHDQSVWKIIIPHGEYLSHDSLVIIKSPNKSKDLYLTVYRNEQGHFMPGMTSSGEAPFWRIQKDFSHDVNGGQFVKEGDTISLCWRFSDQSAGFRDFQDDVFGRRRFTKPDDVEDELTFKIPFPGFQKGTGSGNESMGMPMIMSAIKESRPILQSLRVLPWKDDLASAEVTYNLFDTKFRIDLISNAGRGEQDDYLTAKLDQTSVVEVNKTLSAYTTISTSINSSNTGDMWTKRADDIGTALLGPAFPVAAKEVKAVLTAGWGFMSGLFD